MSAANILLRITSEDLASAGLTGLAGALRGLSYGLYGLNQQLGTTGYTLGEFLGATAGAGAAFGLFLSATKSATSQSADLQYALVQMNIAIIDGPANANALAQAVINIGNASVFTHTQVAQTFTQLGEMGFTAEQILNGVGKAAVNMSIAMGIDGVQGAQLLGQSLQVYNADASQAAHFSDVLTRSFYDSGVGADGLQQAISQAGGMAHVMGINFTDFMTTIDLMSRSMGSGSKAGTSLRYMLSALTKPTAAEADELNRLGIVTVNQTSPALNQLTEMVDGASAAALRANGTWDGTVKGLENIYTAGQAAGKIPLDVSFQDWAASSKILNDKLYDSNGNFLGLKNAIDQIIKGLKGMSPEQIQEVMDSLFNVRGGQGAEQMVGLLGQFDGKYQQIYKDLNQTGTAQSDANKLLDTAKGRWQQLGTTMNSFMAQTGGPINTVLSGIYQGLNNIVSAASNSQPVKDFFSLFLPIGAVLGGVAAGFLLVAGAIALGLGPVLAPFLITFAAVAVVAGLLSGALLLIKQGFDDVGKKASPLGAVFAPIKKFFEWAWNYITTKLGPALKGLGINWKELGIVLLLVLTPIIAVAVGILAIAAALLLAGVAITKFFQWLDTFKVKLLALVIWLDAHWKDFTNWAQSAVTLIENLFASLPGTVQASLVYMRKLAKAELDGTVGDAVLWGVNFSTPILSALSKTYVSTVTWAANEKALISGVFTYITTAVATFIVNVETAWDNFWNGLLGFVQQTISNIEGAFNSFTSWLQGAWNNVTHILPGGGFLGAAAQSGQTTASMFATGLLNGRGLIRSAAAQLALSLQQGLAPGAASLSALGSLNAQAAAYAGAAGAYGQAGNNTFIIQVGSKEVGRIVMDQVRHQLQMSGGARLQRK